MPELISINAARCMGHVTRPLVVSDPPDRPTSMTLATKGHGDRGSDSRPSR